VISLIVAVSRNGVIGRDGNLPWRLSDDLKRFKSLTTGKPIIMGRKTYESIGRPLPHRQNIVISRDAAFQADGCDVVSTPELAIGAAEDAREVMVIGGGIIYELFIDKATRLYVTRVHADVEGDTFFPEIDPLVWRLEKQETVEADERNEYAFDFLVYDRR
jgi:dihydrofolate reductase